MYPMNSINKQRKNDINKVNKGHNSEEVMDKDIFYAAHEQICLLMRDDVHGMKVKPLEQPFFNEYQVQFQENLDKYLDIIGAMIKKREEEIKNKEK